MVKRANRFETWMKDGIESRHEVIEGFFALLLFGIGGAALVIGGSIVIAVSILFIAVMQYYVGVMIPMSRRKR